MVNQKQSAEEYFVSVRIRVSSQLNQRSSTIKISMGAQRKKDFQKKDKLEPQKRNPKREMQLVTRLTDSC